MWPNPAFLGVLPPPGVAGFAKDYALACFDPLRKSQGIGGPRAAEILRCSRRCCWQCRLSARVFNDYDFGGYLIANGRRDVIDGRTNSMAKNSLSTTSPPFTCASRCAPHIEPALTLKAK